MAPQSGRAELTGPGGYGWNHPFHPRCDLLSSSNHFALILYSYEVNPVALPPGRARLSTKPVPTGIVRAYGVMRP